MANNSQPYVFFCFLLKFIKSHKILDPQNIHEKKFWTRKIPTKKSVGPAKYPRKKFGPTKYPREKFQNHDGTVA